MELREIQELVERFDPENLAYPWSHPDPAVDALQKKVLTLVENMTQENKSRSEIFLAVWSASQDALETQAPPPEMHMEAQDRVTIPFLTEPWYC